MELSASSLRSGKKQVFFLPQTLPGSSQPVLSFLLSEGQTLWSLPVSFSVLFISLWGRFYYGQLSPECWQVQCCRQAGTQINSTKTQPATWRLRGCSKRHDLVPSLSETRIVSSLLGRARDRQNCALSSSVLLCLMVFRGYEVRGCVLLVLLLQHCEIHAVWVCSAQLWVLNFLFFWKFQFLEITEGVYSSVVYLGQGSLNSVLHAKGKGRQTWTHMVSTVLAVSLTPADYIILLLGIHLRIHKVSVCFCSELVCTPWRQKQFL